MRRKFVFLATIILLVTVACSNSNTNVQTDQTQESEAQESSGKETPKIVTDLHEADLTELLTYFRNIRVERTFLFTEEELINFKQEFSRDGKFLPAIIANERDEETGLFPYKVQDEIFWGLLVREHVATTTFLAVTPSPPFFDPSHLFDKVEPNRLLLRITLLPNPLIDGNVEPEELFYGTLEELNEIEAQGMSGVQTFTSNLALLPRPEEKTIQVPTGEPRHFEGGIENFTGEVVIYFYTVQRGMLPRTEIGYFNKHTWNQLLVEPQDFRGSFFFAGSMNINTLGSPVFILDQEGRPLLLGFVVALDLTPSFLGIQSEGDAYSVDIEIILELLDKLP